jgi:hypothetical protein
MQPIGLARGILLNAGITGLADLLQATVITQPASVFCHHTDNIKAPNQRVFFCL